MKYQSNGIRFKNNNAGTVAQLERLLEFLKSEEGSQVIVYGDADDACEEDGAEASEHTEQAEAAERAEAGEGAEAAWSDREPRSDRAREFELQQRWAEELLNELGLREETCDWAEWPSQLQWASFNYAREARLLAPTGESPSIRLRHRIRLPDAEAVSDFLADARMRRHALEVVSIEQLAETLEDRCVKLEGDVEASALELTRLTSALIRAASDAGGSFDNYQEVPVKGGDGADVEHGVISTSLHLCWAVDADARVLEDGQPAHVSALRHGANDKAPCDVVPGVAAVGESKAPAQLRQLKGRTEFLRDTFIVRLLMAPHAVQWKDADGGGFLSDGPGVVHGMDSDFEVVLSESAPCLDHLRWMVNQVPDLHVAAESLQYEAKYTGDRLPHDLVERMTPPVEVREQMASRLGSLVEALEAMTEDISAAHQAVRSTLPKRAHRS